MNRNNFFLATTLGNDPHTEGIHNAMDIAQRGGIDGMCVPPDTSLDSFCEIIRNQKPKFIGLSYRLTPSVGIGLLHKTINYFHSTGLITSSDNVKICFAALPETIEQLRPLISSLPLKVHLVEPRAGVMERVSDTMEFFEIKKDRERLLSILREELVPEGIKMLDEIADEVISHDDYKNEPPLPVPSNLAINSFIRRIHESPIPVLRSHFGIPSDTVEPTVEGIRKLAKARVIDELSLGSSDLSQRYFGHPELFEQRKNDGGVPYKTVKDLQKLYLATRTGNFPSIKPYCHVVDIVPFINTCLDIGILKGAHQAIPLYWFNELDKRGPHSVQESIYEHFDAVKELVRHNIPVEMNDPNQWSSRYAHDTIITTSYALIAAVMTMCGVNDMIVQMQFNKPKETGDFADLAKMSAARILMERINSYQKNKTAAIHIETRTGIESLSSDMTKAKWQLGRSTLLQMYMNPDIIHIVSYCEANYAARPDDIIDSSKLIRKAVKLFRENEHDLLKEAESDIIKARREYLIKETSYLLSMISRHTSVQIENLTPFLGTPEAILYAIESGIMSAPGIINPKYKGHFLTKPMKYGMINLVDNYINPNIVTEKERLKHHAN